MAVIRRATFLFALIALVSTSGLGAEAPLPSIDDLIKSAELREQAMDDYDASVQYECYKRSEATPFVKTEIRWISQGNCVHVDAIETALKSDYVPMPELHFVFDGKVGKSYEPTRHEGSIFEDIKSETQRPSIRGPEFFGCSLPDTLGYRLSSLLRANPYLCKNGKLTPHITIGNWGQQQDIGPIIAIQARVGDALYVVNLARSFGWDISQCELYVGDHVSQEKLVAKTEMREFKEIKPHVWYPAVAEYWSYQLKSVPVGREVLRLKQINWPSSMDSKLFQLDFPPNTRISDMVLGTSYFYGPKDLGDISVSLPRPASSGDDRSPKSRILAEYSTLIVIGLAGIGMVAWYSLRKRRFH